MGAPVFSVIIPVFNNWELTRACLCSLKEHTAEPFEVIVVDNASSDATAAELAPLGEALFGHSFSRIVFPENRNFGPACNAGARAAKAPLLFFLNNDTLVTEGWAAPLLDALEKDSSLGAVGPLLLYEDKTVQHLGVAFSLHGVFHLYQGFSSDHPVVAKKRYVQALTAAAIMVPRALFEQCGGFHEEYRNGFEDVELCLRLVALGKRLRCVSDSRIYHLESRTPGRRESEQHNAALLSERCGDLYRIDMHHHALRDGFQPFLNIHLTLSVILRPEEEQRLTDIYRDADPQTMVAAIRANPYWEYGAEHLASLLERAGEPARAAAILGVYANVHPAVPRLQKVLRLAREGGLDQLAFMAEKSLSLAFDRQGDKKMRRLRLLEILKIADKQDDGFLRNEALKALGNPEPSSQGMQ